MGLSGCALPPEQASSFRENYYTAQSVALTRFGQMQGNYISTGTDPTQLTVTPERSEDLGEAALLWTQSDVGDSSNLRQFRIAARGTGAGVTGIFAPLLNGQLTTRVCPLTWQLAANESTSGILQASTDQSGCVFQSNGASVALHKEIVFDGDFITVADRIDGPDMPASSTMITQFVRLKSASARVARLDVDQWRMAVEFEMPADGQRRQPTDAAGMDLGVGISLRLQTMDSEPQWRLVVSDKDSSEIIGQAWADWNAQRIGWANEKLQVEIVL